MQITQQGESAEQDVAKDDLSPLDFVLEELKCQMPDEADGGD